tara:strand:+ start:648 stop:1010 length:363 start_codon:yes stop_codon:yes gene_type:complete
VVGCSLSQHIDGLSAEQLRKSLEGIPSTLQGARSALRNQLMIAESASHLACDPVPMRERCWRARVQRQVSAVPPRPPPRISLPPSLYVSTSGMRSPMGESSRSECLAGMDMLNDMFQRQV